MNIPVLTLVVVGQVVVFQFASVAFTRSVFTVLLGDSLDPPARETAAYLRKAGRRRYLLGGVFLLLVLATRLVFPATSVTAKLLLAAVSLASSGAFAYAWRVDRRAVCSMRDALPEAGVRRASLKPRAVSHGYRSLWELLPVAIVLATAVFTIEVGGRLERISTEMWTLQILQAVFVFGALAYTRRYGIGVPNVSSRLAMLRNRPELALEFGERLAALEMCYFMAAKIGVALLLGLGVAGAGAEALGHATVPALDGATWVIAGLLLVLFAVFIVHLLKLTKGLLRHVPQHPRETDTANS